MLWLTINRADKGNAIPYYVRDRLIQRVPSTRTPTSTVRAIVLTAAGERHFCTGADLSVPPAREAASPTARPTWWSARATQMMRAGFQRLMEAMPGLPEAGDRRAQRHRGRRRRRCSCSPPTS